MLDLETMGTAGDSAIIAIGAVAFDNSGVKQKFYTNVNLQSCIDLGLKVDGSTVIWWMGQSDQARSIFSCDSPHLNVALLNFANWFKSVNGDEVWGNGAAFDNVILSTAYRKAQLQQPWKFWNDRCYRTIKNLNPSVKLNRVGTYHNAVDDAESQALHLIDIMARN